MGNKYFAIGEEMTGKLVYDITGKFSDMYNELRAKYSDLLFHDMMIIYDSFIRVCFVKDWIYSNREIDIMIGSKYESCLNKYASENFVDILSKYFETYERRLSNIHHMLHHQYWDLVKNDMYEYEKYKKRCSVIWDIFKEFTIELLEYIQHHPKKLMSEIVTVKEFVCLCEPGQQVSFSKTNDEDECFIFIKSNSMSSYESGGTMVIRDSMSDEQKSSFENCITVSN